MEKKVGDQVILDPTKQQRIITGLMLVDFVEFTDVNLEALFGIKTEGGGA